MIRDLLILGCGDLGTRIAQRATDRGWRVTGLRRNPPAGPAAFSWRAGDLGVAGGLEAVAGAWDAVVYCPAPGARTLQAYRTIYVDGLARSLRRINAGRLVLVTSTAVYGNDDGSWVDETAPCRPKRFNGEILLEAEALLTRRPEAVVTRPAGLYGPGRDYLVGQVKAGRATARQWPPQWTNRIHVEDAAGFIAHLLDMDQPDRLYCLTDGHPAPRHEVLNWLAGRLGCAPPGDDPDAAGSGRRVANARMLATDYELRYPDYRAGYTQLLEEAGSCRT